jgi:hypothetical protein
MTAVNGATAPGADLGALTALPGLKVVTGPMADLIAVLRAEQARSRAGIEIRRPAWKNLVFTGGPGTGKSRVTPGTGRAVQGPGTAELRAPDRDRRCRPGPVPPRGTPRPRLPRSSSQPGTCC